MDRDDLIPIGRFAKLTDLSPRFLRKLDERGLLSPVHIDPETKYRFYDLTQTRAAALVHLARQLGLTLDQIADLVAAAQRGTVRPQLERYRDVVAAQFSEQARLLRLIDQELAREQGPSEYEVSLKDLPAVLVMSVAGCLPRPHPHDPWEIEYGLRRIGARAIAHVARQGAEPDLHGIILYHSDSERDDELRFEVCLPLADPLPDGPGVTCKELPATRAAVLSFRGAYDMIWNAHVELRAWVEERRLKIAGPLRETGIVTDADTDDPREWLTELALPVETE